MAPTYTEIINFCFYYTAIGMLIILLSFLIPWRSHPPLDWAFIAKQLGLVSLLAITLAVRRGLVTVGDIKWAWLAIWLFVVCAQTAVLYYIYRERFGPGFLRRLSCRTIGRWSKRCNLG